MSYLVDTNIIGELCQRKPDQGVLAWMAAINRFAVSVVSMESIFFGLPWHPNARVLAWTAYRLW